MRASLATWISDAESLLHLDRFRVSVIPLSLAYQRTRKDDLYIALVGELFDRMREDYADRSDWARLANALAEYASPDRVSELRSLGISRSEAALFAAAAFYFGGYPASAWLTMKSYGEASGDDSINACFDLLARPTTVTSTVIQTAVSALNTGDIGAIASIELQVAQMAESALHIGPSEWISARLLQKLLGQFRRTNLRAVLPDGQSEFWTPLISLFRRHGVWDFFPSQIQAIQNGLLESSSTFSLQMPTGAGKTALCETLLYWHLKRNLEDVAVFLVPYRSLASELRTTLVPRLNLVGISARCAYGGTVPTGDEVQALDDTRALIATPETLSGILSAHPLFLRRISLLICDEGHLLDAPSRGIGLELLLARMKAREGGAPRFVFVSAIVPNIEEINAWLGGSSTSVVRSNYRPALAEFAVLRSRHGGNGLDLEMHPQESLPIRYRIEGFLQRNDFQWLNQSTQRLNTYPFNSVKTRAIAAARKALPMGTAIVFAANKRGNQGAIGLTQELLSQLDRSIQLPEPIDFADRETINITADYLEREYGTDWLGTRALKAGAVLHHGDVPQETREVVELIVRTRRVQFGICTNTLAEGVNLPIRTLVLYSVQRRGKEGRPEDLLTRDIKNLVGRAGRAGATTKGLVICANEEQWPLVEPVARQAAGEHVVGALRSLIERVRRRLAVTNMQLTNALLEKNSVVHSLIDGIDATLVDLAVSEIGEEDLVRLATQVADQTFAAQQTDSASKQLLRDVFALRARRIVAIRSAGRLEWIRDTGARARMLDLVEVGLLPMRPRWDDVTDPVDPEMVNVMLNWAWAQHDIQQAVRDIYSVDDNSDVNLVRESFFNAIRLWLSGGSFLALGVAANLPMDDLLGLHARVVTFTIQTIIEQAIALLQKLLPEGQTLAPAVVHFPEHLRFGVPTAAGRVLASGGVRHRRACVMLGNTPELNMLSTDDRLTIFNIAQSLLTQDREGWQGRLGILVLANTLRDISLVTGRES